jgi:hypothetical protein
MSLKDYLSNNNSRRTEVDAAFEVDSIPPSAPVSAPKQARPKQFKRIGRPSGKPAQSAKGKRLTVVANAAPVSAPKAKGILAKLKAKAAASPKGGILQRLKGKKTASPAPKKTPLKSFLNRPGVKKAAPFAAGAMLAMPVAAGAMLAIKNRKAIGAGIKKVASGNFLKKTAPIAAFAAGAPIAAGAMLFKKGGAKNIVKKLPKIKLRRRR